MIRITQKFLDYFDLPDQEAARKLFKDFRDEDIQKKVSEFKDGKADSSEDSEEQLGDLKVYDAGQEEDIYDDRKTLEEKHNPLMPEQRLGDLDVYEETPQKVSEDRADEKSDEDEDAEQDLDRESVDSEGKGGHAGGEDGADEDVDEAERARRIAEELLAEDQPRQETKEEDVIPGREIHPELENYLAEGNEEGDEWREKESGASPAASKKQDVRPDVKRSMEQTRDDDQEEDQDSDDAVDDGTTDDDYEKKRRALETEELAKASGRPEDEDSEPDGEGAGRSDND